MIREQGSKTVPKGHSTENKEGYKSTTFEAFELDSTFGDRNSQTKPEMIRFALLLMSPATQGCF